MTTITNAVLTKETKASILDRLMSDCARIGRAEGKGSGGLIKTGIALFHASQDGGTHGDDTPTIQAAWTKYAEGVNASAGDYASRIDTDPETNGDSIKSQVSKLALYAKLGKVAFLGPSFFETPKEGEDVGNYAHSFVARVKACEPTSLTEGMATANRAQKAAKAVLTDDELRALFVKKEKKPETEMEFWTRMAKAVESASSNKKYGLDELTAKVGRAIQCKVRDLEEQDDLAKTAERKRLRDAAAKEAGEPAPDSMKGLRLIEREQTIITDEEMERAYKRQELLAAYVPSA